MKLSIWNLYDWLKQATFDVIAFVNDGKAELTGIRMLTSNCAEPGMVLITPQSAFDISYEGVLLVHENDVLHVHSSSIEDVFNEVSSCFDFYRKWEEHILDVAHQPNALQVMIDLSHEIFQNPIFLYYPTGQIAALSSAFGPDIHFHWKELMQHRWIPKDRMEQLQQIDNLSKVFQDIEPQLHRSELFGSRYIHCSIMLHGKRIIQAVLCESSHFKPGDIYLFSLLVNALSKHIESHSIQYEFQNCAILHDLLLEKETPSVAIDTFMCFSGWHPNDTLILASIKENVESEFVLLARLCEQLSKRLVRSYVFVHENDGIVIINLSKAKITLNKIQETLQADIDQRFTCCFSLPFSGIHRIAAYYQQTLDIHRYSTKRSGNIFFLQDCALDILTRKMRELPWVGVMIYPDLQKILAYDQAHGTHCFDSLFAFLKCGGNITDAARLLNIHRNTLIYRIDRAKELIGVDIYNIEAREYLLFSYRLMQAEGRF